MKDGGFRKASRPISSHLIKPVLNGLSDLLRLPQYPVLGVRAAASTGVRREGELYTQAQGEGKGGNISTRDAHKSGKNSNLGALSRPRMGAGATSTDPGPSSGRPAFPTRGAPRQPSQSGPLAGTGKPAPQGNLGIKEEGAQV